MPTLSFGVFLYASDLTSFLFSKIPRINCSISSYSEFEIENTPGVSLLPTLLEWPGGLTPRT